MTLSDPIRPCGTPTDAVGPCRTLSNPVSPCRTPMDPVRPCRTLSDAVELLRSTLSQVNLLSSQTHCQVNPFSVQTVLRSTPRSHPNPYPNPLSSQPVLIPTHSNSLSSWNGSHCYCLLLTLHISVWYKFHLLLAWSLNYSSGAHNIRS